jgi:hypothetical protein
MLIFSVRCIQCLLFFNIINSVEEVNSSCFRILLSNELPVLWRYIISSLVFMSHFIRFADLFNFHSKVMEAQYILYLMWTKPSIYACATHASESLGEGKLVWQWREATAWCLLRLQQNLTSQQTQAKWNNLMDWTWNPEEVTWYTSPSGSNLERVSCSEILEFDLSPT